MSSELADQSEQSHERLKRLRAVYDEDQRRQIEFPDCRREITPNVIRLIDLFGTHSAVLYSKLTAENADQVIAGEIAYFEGIGQEFEWKYFSHDTPADLLDRLIKHGFETGEEEAILILPLDEAPKNLFTPPVHTIRRITDPASLTDVVAVENQVWGGDHTEMGERLKHELSVNPDMLSIYVAYVDNIPASCAWARFSSGSQFGSLWGGSTVEVYRGQGLYRALLAVRAREAKRRGVKFLTVDASPMSRPILERLGFQWISLSRECTWTLR